MLPYAASALIDPLGLEPQTSHLHSRRHRNRYLLNFVFEHIINMSPCLDAGNVSAMQITTFVLPVTAITLVTLVLQSSNCTAMMPTQAQR